MYYLKYYEDSINGFNYTFGKKEDISDIPNGVVDDWSLGCHACATGDTIPELINNWIDIDCTVIFSADAIESLDEEYIHFENLSEKEQDLVLELCVDNDIIEELD